MRPLLGEDVASNSTLHTTFHNWQIAHAQSTQDLQKFYAPNAKIYVASLKPQTPAQFCAALQRAHDAGTYDQVDPQTLSQDTDNPMRVGLIDGDDAEIRCRSFYRDSRDGAWRSSRRRLLWHRENGVWRITTDWFPTTYQESLLAFPSSPAMKKTPTLP